MRCGALRCGAGRGAAMAARGWLALSSARSYLSPSAGPGPPLPLARPPIDHCPIMMSRVWSFPALPSRPSAPSLPDPGLEGAVISSSAPPCSASPPPAPLRFRASEGTLPWITVGDLNCADALPAQRAGNIFVSLDRFEAGCPPAWPAPPPQRHAKGFWRPPHLDPAVPDVIRSSSLGRGHRGSSHRRMTWLSETS